MKLLYILIVVVFFIGSFVLGFQVRAQELGVRLYDIGEISSLPILTNSNGFPTVSGQGVIAVDGESNVTLYEKNADEKLYPASTTKIITALVGLDYFKLSDILTVEDPIIEGQRMGLVETEQLTFESLINALLIYSANDAAVAIADNYPGGREAFVDAMNNKAKELHLENSHFANPAGLDDERQVTTARDMVRVGIVAMQNPVFAKIVGTKEKSVTDITKRYSYGLTNVNQLLGNVDGVMGIKTGWTEAARENLITYVDKSGHKIYMAVLGSQDRFGETTELIDWIYGNYTWQKVTFTQKAVGQLILNNSLR